MIHPTRHTGPNYDGVDDSYYARGDINLVNTQVSCASDAANGELHPPPIAT